MSKIQNSGSDLYGYLCMLFVLSSAVCMFVMTTMAPSAANPGDELNPCRIGVFTGFMYWMQFTLMVDVGSVGGARGVTVCTGLSSVVIFANMIAGSYANDHLLIQNLVMMQVVVPIAVSWWVFVRFGGKFRTWKWATAVSSQVDSPML